MKEGLIKELVKKTKLKKKEIENILEIPPSLEMGDFAFPCFVLSKKLKKAPNIIVEELAEKFKNLKISGFEKIEVKGPYLNFFIDKKKLAEKIISINANFGRQNFGKKKNILIDFSAPNIGKPMHIGHIRSTILGDSLMRIYDFLNYNSVGINYLGDVGLHIGKLIVAYEMWLDRDALKKNPVDELLRLYVKFCSNEKTEIREGLDEDIQDNEWTNKAKEKIKLLELGNKKTHEIWRDIRKASQKGFDKVYEMLKVNFTETTGQSFFEKMGKELVINAEKKGIIKQEPDRALFIEINGKKKFVLRSNQTASYITYDLGAAVERAKKYPDFEKMIYVTDFRQQEYFSNLFEILNKLGYKFYKKLKHLPFGTINFEKEIIASRYGNVIKLEDVLVKTIKRAEEEIKKRKTKGDAEKVGVGAVKYIILKNEPIRDVNFSWENALNFEGNTGPYLQYSYARASSIIKKAGKFNKKKIKIPDLSKEEISLINEINKFPAIVERAEQSMNPSLIANYSYELAKSFNEFYHICKVVGDKNEGFRLKLVDAFRTCLKNSLYLLGIEVMEEM